MSDASVSRGPAPDQFYSRQATGLVREVSLLDMAIYNVTCTSPLGSCLVFALFTLLLFPRASFFIAWPVAVLLSIFVWTTFALMSAAIPRIGGDYTYNSRVLHPLPAFAVNVCTIVSSILAGGLWATWMATIALSGVLGVIGAVTKSSTISDWGSQFSSSHPTVVFITALVALAITTGLAIRGTRVLVRAMTVMFIIAAVGFFADLAVLLFTSQSSFETTLNSVIGPGTYANTVTAGASLYGSVDASQTIGAIAYMLSFNVYIYLGIFLAPEFKGAGQRRRQLISMVGGGIVQGLLVLIGAAIFLNTVGTNFFISALAGNFGPGLSDYDFFASVVAQNNVLVTILALTFLGWWLPGMYINLLANQRAYMTWSFDGLLPQRVSDVNDRTHTPVVAIALSFIFGAAVAAWGAYSQNFFTVFAYSLLLGYLPVVLVGISAIVMRSRRPELYKGSAADWRVAGIEVLPLAGAGCVIVGVLDIIGLLYYHEPIGFHSLGWAIAAPLIGLSVGTVWWLTARAIRSRQGVNLSLIAKSIPPE